VEGAQPDEFYTDDWHDPSAMHAEGERQVADDDLREAMIIGSDPEVHVDRIRDVIDLGATTIILNNNSGADPLAAVRTYAEHVLPALR
jgi:coenzyme F420-dependent glucose-6-phosphate dehydrogenase